MRTGDSAFVPSGELDPIMTAAMASLEAGEPTGDAQIDGAALQMCLGSGTPGNDHVAPIIDLWIARHGSERAIDALDHSTRLACVGGFGELQRLVRAHDDDVDPQSSFSRGIALGWSQLRARLSAEREAAWKQAHARASHLRATAPLMSRMALAYLFPDEPSWSDDAAKEALRTETYRYGALIHLAPMMELATLETLIAWRGSWAGEHKATPASMIVRFGGAATALVVRYLDAKGWVPDKSAQRACAEGLVWLGTPEAAMALAERLDMKAIAPIVVEAFLARPTWARPALEVCAARRNTAAKTLLTMVTRAEQANELQ